MNDARSTAPLALAALLVALARPVDAQCSNIIVFHEEFSSGALPPGWSKEGLWTIAAAPSCALPCARGPVAYYGGSCGCNGLSLPGCTGDARLTSPNFVLPP